MMKTFSESQAMASFRAMAHARFRNPKAGISPSDICLFAWLVAEAERVNCNPFYTTISDIQLGFEVQVNGKRMRVAPVGLALNTVRASLARLEHLGYIVVTREQLFPKGQKLNVTIKGEDAPQGEACAKKRTLRVSSKS